MVYTLTSDTTEVQAGTYTLSISTLGPGVTVTVERWHEGQWHHAGGLLPDASLPGGNGCQTTLPLPACGVRAITSPDTAKASATLTPLV